MRFLLDTHILIWALGRLDLLPNAMRDLLEDPASTIYFSVINVWEMVIKTNLPRTDLHVNPRDARREALAFGFRELQLTAEHVLAVCSLPPLHRDPFDRMLIAQARSEDMELLTVDVQVLQYRALWTGK